MRTRGIITKLLLSAVFSVTAISVCMAAQTPDSLKTSYGFSVRTNLVWAAAAEPNAGFEIPVGEHVTVGANGGLKAWPRWMPWDWDYSNATHWRNFAVVPELRYYLGQIYDGLFAGTDFIYTHFNVGDIDFPFGMYSEASDYRLQGAYWAAGVFAGYAWWPLDHWRFEVEAGISAGLAAYDRFDCPHCGTKLGQERKPAVVPKLGVNVAYNPVGKEEMARRRKARSGGNVSVNNIVLSGTDTITVLSPPVAFVVHLKDVEAPQSTGDSLSRENHWVIPIEKYRPLDHLTRPGTDSVQYVNFKLNDSQLIPDYRSNARVLSQLEKAILRIKADARTDEMLISIVGLASIDGPQALNDTLSKKRAMAVADYLSLKTGISRRFFETLGKGEAWDWFKDQLEAIPGGGEGLTAEQVATLLDIIENEPDADLRERRMRADASLYRILQTSLLENQRNSGYIRVYYHTAPHQPTEQFNGKIYDLIKAKRYHDAVRAIQDSPELMERAKDNPEAMNAYGVALYFTALDNKDTEQEHQAIELIRTAARNGSEAASQNLEETSVYSAARKEYEAWLEAMKEE